MATLGADIPRTNSLWLRSAKWDLTWVSLSVLLMVIPYGTYYFAQGVGLDADTARNAVNMLIAFGIGGPHMYATYTRTIFEPTFRKAHWTIIPMGVIIPSFVIYMAAFQFTYLLSFFFMWASIHVLHQIIFLVDCYRTKDQAPQSKYSKWIDYAVVLSALYPMAMYRFVDGSFKVGQTTLFFPELLKVDATWILVTAFFSLALVMYIMKTIREFRNGTGNLPKTILISITVIATFSTPFYPELDVAFQGLNSWHSFQYLGLTWLINRYRLERGEITMPAMRKLAEPGKWWRYYGFVVLASVSAIMLIGMLILTDQYHGLSFDQAYYMVILCFLLTHYYQDHILFQNPEEIKPVSF